MHSEEEIDRNKKANKINDKRSRKMKPYFNTPSFNFSRRMKKESNAREKREHTKINWLKWTALDFEYLMSRIFLFFRWA